MPPVLCLTATAKPDVVADILAHFKDKVGIELRCFNGGASRTNLDFCVVQTTPAEKYAHIHQIPGSRSAGGQTGGAIVYCATRKQTRGSGGFLPRKGLAAGTFTPDCRPKPRRACRKPSSKAALRVIVATNAFGMGIDKPDVRLVIHADIPGSLENYLQEAGRAGRDRQAARCVLLYTAEDVERQFGMSARSRLTRKEIQSDPASRCAISTARSAGGGDVDRHPGRNPRRRRRWRVRARFRHRRHARAHRRVVAGGGALLSREENRVQVFPRRCASHRSKRRGRKLARSHARLAYRQQLLALVGALIGAPM